VELLTIGAFARAARLTPKALRLYDELGLLPPAAVDSESGYRYYDPAQLDRARLIAWLRRIGMPLARIRDVCALAPAAAAAAVAAFWAEVEADTAERERLVAFLVEHLTGRNTTMELRFAARTDQGQTRKTNDDFAYAGSTLLAVADGVGGTGGAQASEAAVTALRDWPGTGLESLLGAVRAARDAVVALADGDDRPSTTLTALIPSGSQLGLVHVGDSRAYLRRGGELSRLTQDHTYVQTLVDSGRLTSEAAARHPQRALLTRALGGPGDADISLRTALAGDRYLLCSDGLSAVVDAAAVAGALGAEREPGEIVEDLIGLAYAAGAPDNIAVVVADVVTG
jgi:serine/threonine protein phosphatase PrpC